MEVLREMTVSGIFAGRASDPELNDKVFLEVDADQIMGAAATIHGSVELSNDPVRVLPRDQRSSTRHG